VIKDVKDLPGIRDLDSTLIPGKPEISGTVDRNKAGEMGASIQDISGTLRLLVGGLDVSTYDDSGEQYDIHLQAEESYRNSREILNLLTVPSTKAGPVAITNLLTLENTDSPSQINRLNRRRQVTITANNAPGVGETEILEGIATAVKKLNLPADYASGSAGRSKEMAKAGKAFMVAFFMAFIFMYLILAAQFESWVHPFTILLALPLTLPFAILSLILFQQSVNIFSMLGILVLFGMVKKNGILQIDHTNQLRAKGMDRLDAILLANKERLRPILMTTLAFVAGMIPMMTAKGVGAAYNNATAGVILGGQSLSLLLTLLATPVIYSIFDDAHSVPQRRREKEAPPKPLAKSEDPRARSPCLNELSTHDQAPPFASPLRGLASCAVGPTTKSPTHRRSPPRSGAGSPPPRAMHTRAANGGRFSRQRTQPPRSPRLKSSPSLKPPRPRRSGPRRRPHQRLRLAPDIRLKGDAKREQTSGNLPTPVPVSIPAWSHINSFSTLIDLSYEIDFWGKVRREVESARATAAAADASYHSAILTLTGDVAAQYFLLRSYDAEVSTLCAAPSIARKMENLLDEKLKAGAIPETDLARAQTEVATAKR
jgi:hypothetical protein